MPFPATARFLSFQAKHCMIMPTSTTFLSVNIIPKQDDALVLCVLFELAVVVRVEQGLLYLPKNVVS